MLCNFLYLEALIITLVIMFRKLALDLFIAWRYLRSQNRVPLFNVRTQISLLFMALMVFVMLIVLCVFTGFQNAVHKTLDNSGYHLTVTQQNNKPFRHYSKILVKANKNMALQELTRHSFESISLNALIENFGQFEVKGLRALPLVPADNILESMVYFPRLIHYNKKYLQRFNNGNYVLIGREMARHYGLQVGSKLRLLLPRGVFIDRNINIREHNFTIAGFYRTGFYEFDSQLLFVSIKTAQKVLQLPRQVTEVIFQLNDLSRLDEAKTLIQTSLPYPRYRYVVHTIREEQGTFLAALQLEKTLMMIILSLLIMAGAAGIWVTVRLLVKAKVSGIGMLRAMGMSSNSLFLIFTVHSMIIGLLATILGGSLGIYVANRLETFVLLIEDLVNYLCNLLLKNCSDIKLIPENVYYFDHLPVQADLGIIFGIGLATLILSGLAGYFPAREAATLDPVQNHS